MPRITSRTAATPSAQILRRDLDSDPTLIVPVSTITPAAVALVGRACSTHRCRMHSRSTGLRSMACLACSAIRALQLEVSRHIGDQQHTEETVVRLLDTAIDLLSAENALDRDDRELSRLQLPRGLPGAAGA